MKKVLSFILSVLMIVSVISVTAFASSDDKCTAGQKNIVSDALSVSVVDSKGNIQESGSGKRIDLAYITDGKTDTGTYSPKIQNFSICITYLNENTFNKIVATINGSGTLYGYSEGKPLETDEYNIQNIQFIFYDMDGIKVYETENFDTSGLKEVILDNISVRASKIEMKVTAKPGETSWSGKSYIWEVETYAEIGSHAYVYDSGSSVAPSCTEAGKRVYKCECGAVKEETIPASGIHTWDEGTVTTPATETTPGVKTFTCTVCKETTTEAIPATGGHNWDTGTVVAPTCTDRGYTLYKCTDTGCEETYKDNFVNALGHDFDTGVLVKRSSATEKGKMKYTCKRSGCDYSYTDDLPLARYSDAISVIKNYNVKSATATSNYAGGSQSWAAKSSSDVKNIIDGNTGTIWASGKSEDTGKFEGTATIELDYEYIAIGCKLYVWSNYNTFMIDFFDESGKSILPVKTMKDKDGNVIEYTYKTLSNVQMTDGYEKTPINLSEDVYLKRVKKIVITIPDGVKWEGIGVQIAEIELTTHKCQYEESEKTNVTPADCVNKTNGSFHGTCYVCGAERDVFVPYDEAHEYNDIVVDKAPTCIEDGVGNRTCKLCGTTETNVIIPATGRHKYTINNEDIAPTCVDAGKGHYTCEVCGLRGSYYEIPATNVHTYVWKNKIEPTYTKEGVSEHVCSVCDAIEDGVTKSIPEKEIEDDLFTFDKYSVRLTDFVGVRATFRFNDAAIDKLERQGYEVEITAYVKNSAGVEKSVKIHGGEDSTEIWGDDGFSVVVKGGSYYDEYSFRINVTITDKNGTATKDVSADTVSEKGGTEVSVCEVAEYLMTSSLSSLTKPVRYFYQYIINNKPKN